MKNEKQKKKEKKTRKMEKKKKKKNKARPRFVMKCSNVGILEKDAITPDFADCVRC
ncbi:hypothetical protein [Poseidonibacter ostreae]|uniref:hypothetical protein n=1 Tax=Poseidonibacter ostreae TaxID=2654171 RepID=UPI00186ACC6A|nr:hypothetical protein [Poseidonibacter ostreae]